VVFHLGGWARGSQLFTVKKQLLAKCYTGPETWMDSSEQPTQTGLQLRIGARAGSCEHCNEPSGFIKGREFLD